MHRSWTVSQVHAEDRALLIPHPGERVVLRGLQDSPGERLEERVACGIGCCPSLQPSCMLVLLIFLFTVHTADTEGKGTGRCC